MYSSNGVNGARRRALAAALEETLIDLNEPPAGADTAQSLALAARADRLSALIQRLDNRRPAWHPAYRQPRGTQLAWTCPGCLDADRTVLLHQAAFFGRDGAYVTVENAFQCNACGRRWWQTLRFQPGPPLENTVR